MIGDARSGVPSSQWLAINRRVPRRTEAVSRRTATEASDRVWRVRGGSDGDHARAVLALTLIARMQHLEPAHFGPIRASRAAQNLPEARPPGPVLPHRGQQGEPGLFVPLDNSLYRHPLFREFLDLPKELEREIRAVGSGVIVDAVFSCPMTRPLDTYH
jgi:hypothetical protein